MGYPVSTSWTLSTLGLFSVYLNETIKFKKDELMYSWIFIWVLWFIYARGKYELLGFSTVICFIFYQFDLFIEKSKQILPNEKLYLPFFPLEISKETE